MQGKKALETFGDLVEDACIEAFAMIEALDKKARNGNWYPANGGTEEPFISKSGRKLLYCWQPTTGNHAYLDVSTDMILSDEEAQYALGLFEAMPWENVNV